MGTIDHNDITGNQWCGTTDNDGATGILLYESGSAKVDHNTIGGNSLLNPIIPGKTVLSVGNLIQGNKGAGVVLTGDRGTGNLVEGNNILDNGGDGVMITTSNNLVGESAAVVLTTPAGGANPA